MSHLFPCLIDLKDKKVLIIGSGMVALKRFKVLASCGAKISVVSRSFSDEFIELAKNNEAELIEKNLYPDDYYICRDYFLVILASSDRPLNAYFEEKLIGDERLYMRLDDGSNSLIKGLRTSYHPSFSISVSSYGNSPVVAGELLEEIEQKLDLEFWDKKISLMAKIRAKAKENILDYKKRYDFLKSLKDKDLSYLENILEDHEFWRNYID